MSSVNDKTQKIYIDSIVDDDHESYTSMDIFWYAYTWWYKPNMDAKNCIMIYDCNHDKQKAIASVLKQQLTSRLVNLETEFEKKRSNIDLYQKSFSLNVQTPKDVYNSKRCNIREVVKTIESNRYAIVGIDCYWRHKLNDRLNHTMLHVNDQLDILKTINLDNKYDGIDFTKNTKLQECKNDLKRMVCKYHNENVAKFNQQIKSEVEKLIQKYHNKFDHKLQRELDMADKRFINQLRLDSIKMLCKYIPFIKNPWIQSTRSFNIVVDMISSFYNNANPTNDRVEQAVFEECFNDFLSELEKLIQRYLTTIEKETLDAVSKMNVIEQICMPEVSRYYQYSERLKFKQKLQYEDQWKVSQTKSNGNNNKTNHVKVETKECKQKKQEQKPEQKQEQKQHQPQHEEKIPVQEENYNYIHESKTEATNTRVDDVNVDNLRINNTTNMDTRFIIIVTDEYYR